MNLSTEKICSHKNCSHKGEPQPKSNFQKHLATKDGLKPQCKDCCREWGIKHNKKVKENLEFYKMFAV